MSLPSPFVLLHGEMQIPPDYAYKAVGTRGFPLAANYRVIEGLVECCLNANLPPESGCSYKPIQSRDGKRAPLYMMVVSYGSMASTCPPFDGWGWMSQQEVVFSIPLLCYRGEELTGIAFYSPYCFVDNAWSMIAGNLIAGYQKGLASFQLQRDLAQPYPMQIETTVFAGHSPETHLSPETWIRVEQRTGPRAERGLEEEALRPFGLFGPLESLYGPAGPFEVGAEVLALLESTASIGLYDLAQLLQIRDPYNPSLAVYSDVVTFAAQLRPPYDGGRLEEAEIAIRSFDSLSVIDTLGLEVRQDRLVNFFPFWTRYDFNLKLHRRP